ncbi:MAG: hypothetical protein ACMG6E_04630, partial [Candidatus Roizmanbacteria bacterium]
DNRFLARKILIGGIKSAFLDLYYNITNGEFLEQEAAEKWAKGGKAGSRRKFELGGAKGMKFLLKTDPASISAMKQMNQLIDTPAEFVAAQLLSCKDFDVEGSKDRKLAAARLDELEKEFDPKTFNIVCRMPIKLIPKTNYEMSFITNAEALELDEHERLRLHIKEQRAAGNTKETAGDLSIGFWIYTDKDKQRPKNLGIDDKTKGAKYLITKVFGWYVQEIEPKLPDILREFENEHLIETGVIEREVFKEDAPKNKGARSVMKGKKSSSKVVPPKNKSGPARGEPNIASDPREEENERQEKEYLSNAVKAIVDGLIIQINKNRVRIMNALRVAAGAEPAKGGKDVFTLDTATLRKSEKNVPVFVMGVVDSSRLFKNYPTMKVGVDIKRAGSEILIPWYPDTARSSSNKAFINFIREKVLQAAFDEFLESAKLGDANIIDDDEEDESDVDERINKLPKKKGDDENTEPETFKETKAPGGDTGFNPELIKSLPKLPVESGTQIQGVLPIVLPDRDLVAGKVFQSDDTEQVELDLTKAFKKIRKFDPARDTSMSKLIDEQTVDVSEVIISEDTFKVAGARNVPDHFVGVDVRVPTKGPIESE